MVELDRDETINLIDALLEWERIVEPKKLEVDEVGLNSQRYIDLMQKLIDSANGSLRKIPYSHN